MNSNTTKFSHKSKSGRPPRINKSEPPIRAPRTSVRKEPINCDRKSINSMQTLRNINNSPRRLDKEKSPPSTSSISDCDSGYEETGILSFPSMKNVIEDNDECNRPSTPYTDTLNINKEKEIKSILNLRTQSETDLGVSFSLENLYIRPPLSDNPELSQLPLRKTRSVKADFHQEDIVQDTFSHGHQKAKEESVTFRGFGWHAINGKQIVPTQREISVSKSSNLQESTKRIRRKPRSKSADSRRSGKGLFSSVYTKTLSEEEMQKRRDWAEIIKRDCILEEEYYKVPYEECNREVVLGRFSRSEPKLNFNRKPKKRVSFSSEVEEKEEQKRNEANTKQILFSRVTDLDSYNNAPGKHSYQTLGNKDYTLSKSNEPSENLHSLIQLIKDIKCDEYSYQSADSFTETSDTDENVTKGNGAIFYHGDSRCPTTRRDANTNQSSELKITSPSLKRVNVENEEESDEEFRILEELIVGIKDEESERHSVIFEKNTEIPTHILPAKDNSLSVLSEIPSSNTIHKTKEQISDTLFGETTKVPQEINTAIGLSNNINSSINFENSIGEELKTFNGSPEISLTNTNLDIHKTQKSRNDGSTIEENYLNHNLNTPFTTPRITEKACNSRADNLNLDSLQIKKKISTDIDKHSCIIPSQKAFSANQDLSDMNGLSHSYGSLAGEEPTKILLSPNINNGINTSKSAGRIIPNEAEILETSDIVSANEGPISCEPDNRNVMTKPDSSDIHRRINTNSNTFSNIPFKYTMVSHSDPSKTIDVNNYVNLDPLSYMSHNVSGYLHGHHSPEVNSFSHMIHGKSTPVNGNVVNTDMNYIPSPNPSSYSTEERRVPTKTASSNNFVTGANLSKGTTQAPIPKMRNLSLNNKNVSRKQKTESIDKQTRKITNETVPKREYLPNKIYQYPLIKNDEVDIFMKNDRNFVDHHITLTTCVNTLNPNVSVTRLKVPFESIRDQWMWAKHFFPLPSMVPCDDFPKVDQPPSNIRNVRIEMRPDGYFSCKNGNSGRFSSTFLPTAGKEDVSSPTPSCCSSSDSSSSGCYSASCSPTPPPPTVRIFPLPTPL